VQKEDLVCLQCHGVLWMLGGGARWMPVHALMVLLAAGCWWVGLLVAGGWLTYISAPCTSTWLAVAASCCAAAGSMLPHMHAPYAAAA
jgi:hypothetical protein